MSEALMSERPKGSGKSCDYGPESEWFLEIFQDTDQLYPEESRDYP
jgi:hypothetical protein